MKNNKHAQCLVYPEDGNANILSFRKYCVLAQHYMKLPVACLPVMVMGSGKMYRVNRHISGDFYLSVYMWSSLEEVRYYTAVAFAEVYLCHTKNIPLPECSSDPEFEQMVERFEGFFCESDQDKR